MALLQQIHSPSATIMKLTTPKERRSRDASPSPSLNSHKMRPETPTKFIGHILRKSSSDPELCQPSAGAGSAPSTPSTPSRKRTGLKKLKNNISKRVTLGKKKGADVGENTDGSESGAEILDRVSVKREGSAPSITTQQASVTGGTPPRPTTIRTPRTKPPTPMNVTIITKEEERRQTINGGGPGISHTNSGDNTPKQQQDTNELRSTPTMSTKSTSRGSGTTASGTGPPSPPRIAMPAVSPPPPFQFVSDDNFTRRVDSYDGQVIACTDSKLPTYEVGNYLGGGVAGVVYEGKRLRPAHEYPPIRVRGGGAFYPNMNEPSPGSPVAMIMKSSSLSSIRRDRSVYDPNKAVTGTGLFADVYRAVVPERKRSSINVPLAGGNSSSAFTNARRGMLTNPSRVQPSDDEGGCTSFFFGNCGNDGIVDDRAVPLSATPMDQRSHAASSASAGKERYAAVDLASIEVPAAFSSMEQETTPTAGGVGGSSQNVHHVVVDDADAPNRSRREARALSRKDGVEQPKVADINRRGKGNSFCDDLEDELIISAGGGENQSHLVNDMSETVAIKILNPVGFRLMDPDLLHKAVIVREGALPTVEADGSFVLAEEHVWWLVNPNSRNLRSLLRKNHHSESRGGSSLQTKGDDASEESSLKREGSLTQSFGGSSVDRGSKERGLRLSLVATYVDPKTNTLRELPLPRCVEIWGHPPFAATDEEFEAMMEALLRLNAGGSSGLRRKQSSSRGRGLGARSGSNFSQTSRGGEDPLASRRAGSTVFCPALSAYIAVPAIPPKYLRWLKQRRLATKEVRNMMRIGRHQNVVHLYEVLEMVQDSKSTMFLILELVRGGELFDLISSNSSSKRKKGNACSENALHEVTMRKFFQELASGIHFIHSCGIAHRDLKPENLLIHTKPIIKDGKKGFDGIAEEEKTLKIADFGLSASFQFRSTTSNNINISRGGSGNSRWDGSSVFDGRPSRQSSGLPLSPHSERGTPNKSGISPLLNRVGATALSMLTCGSMTNVCLEDAFDGDDLVDNGYSDSVVDLRRMTSVVGSPHYVAPEIIAQADKGKGDKGQEPQDRKARHAARAGYDGTKADVWSAGVILYAMLFRSLPFGEDLLRCPRYQAFQKWYNDARQLQPPLNGKKNRRAFPEVVLDPNFDEFDEEEMLGPHWFFPSEISAPGRDLIVAMLNPNPQDRLTIEMVLGHPWLQAMNGMKKRVNSMPRMSGLCISGA